MTPLEIPVLRRTALQLPSTPGSGSTTTTLARIIDTLGWAAGALQVRVYEKDIVGAGSVVRVAVFNASAVPDDPSTIFVSSDPIALVEIAQGSTTAPALLTVQLPTPTDVGAVIGRYLNVQMIVVAGSNGVSGSVTLGVELLGYRGPAGLRGPTGATGATGNTGGAGAAGQGYQWRGAWSSSTAYLAYDTVGYSGSSFVAVAASTNEPPWTSGNTLNAAYWNILALAGDDGATGATGQGYSWQGAWSGLTAYEPYDTVSYDGSSYICILATAADPNNPPDVTPAKWSLIAEKGDVGPTGPSGGADTYTAFWIPDLGGVWEDTGVTAPAYRSTVYRVGTTLYAFGGVLSATAVPTNKIYSASYDGTGTTPVFTDTGATLPTAVIGARIALIGTTIYCFGAKDSTTSGGLAIWSASVTTPTVWTTSGVNIAATIRNNAPLVVANGKIGILGGHTGGAGVLTIRWTSTSTPTSGWADTGTVYASGSWEQAAAVIGDRVCSFGGINNSLSYFSVSQNYWATTPSGWATMPAPFATAITTSSDIFHIGQESVLIGAANTSKTVTLTHLGGGAGIAVDWSGLPYNVGYILGASWIGGDGRIYYIQPDTHSSGTRGKIIRSGRKRCYVLTSEVDAANAVGPYQGMRAVLADGTPASVTSHVRMAVPPWSTNRTTAF